MSSMNHVTLLGNIVRDLEPRKVGDTTVLVMSLAVNDAYRNKANELVKSVTYVDIEVWDKQAELTAKYLKKGSPALIEGKLKLDSWETDDGQKRNKLKVRATQVHFVGQREQTEAA